MDYKALTDKIFELGQEYFDDLEVYIEKNSALTIETYESELEKYEIAETGGISLRGLKDGKTGFSYSEKISEDVLEELVEAAINSHKYIDSEDIQFFHDGSGEYQEIEKENSDFDDYSAEDKINALLEMDRMCREREERIFRITAVYGENKYYSFIRNTKGLYKEESIHVGSTYVYTIVRQGEETIGDIGYQLLKNFKDIDQEKIVAEALEKSVGALGGQPVDSGQYKIVFKNECFSDLLGAFSSLLSADAVQKDLSLLKGKLNEKVASEAVHIIDDPFWEGALEKTSFDGEGYPTSTKDMIKDGVLCTYFHNLKTANKDHTDSTGNASRGSYKSSIGVSHSNLYLKAGESDFDDLLNTMGDGILITEVQALHSGMNPISGDFSLPAKGYRIEEGEKKEPINQITIAGNLFTLMQSVVEVGSDMRLSFGGIASPSVLVKEMSIGGK